ncbi:hypothetical protein ONZ45_g7846 [Pleurotus djamor]|nr:hypothetical protein ONZ45_g7846 [Pleurotus djamor]
MFPATTSRSISTPTWLSGGILQQKPHTLRSHYLPQICYVARLPSEILSLIFEFLPLVELRLDCWKRYAHRLAVSHVCKSWRNVALETPRLWAYIYTHTRLELAELFLKRSKSAPLYLRSSPVPEVADVTNLLLSQAHRLKEINLMYGSKASSWLPKLVKSKTPILETLVLSGCPSFTILKIPSAIDPSQAATLRHVTLFNSYFSLRTPWLSQLRSLSLSSDLDHGPKPTILDVLLALQGMNHLQSLDLRHSLLWVDSVPKDFVVELSDLKSVSIQSMDPRVLTMLHHLSCINIQTVSVRGIGPTDKDVSRSIAGAFCNLLPGTPASWTTTLQVCHYAETETALYVTTNSVPTAGSKSSNLGPSSLTLSCDADYSTCRALVSPFPENPPQTLHLDLNLALRRSNDEDLRALMRSLTSVEKLRIETVQDLAIIMSDVPTRAQVIEARRNHTDAPLCLPSLKRIDVETNSYDLSGLGLKYLQMALRVRNSLAAGIDVLRFKRMMLSDSERDILRVEVKELAYPTG